MPILQPEQIGVYVWGNGHWVPSGDSKTIIAFLDTAIAVAMAESSGNTDAVNGTHYGLYQIGKDSHPDLFVGRKWNDPKDNVEMARQVYNNAHGWSPWQAYTSGAYKTYQGHGQKVYDAVIKATNGNGFFSNLTHDALLLSPVGVAVADVNATGSSVKDLVSGPAKWVSSLTDGILGWLRNAFMTVAAFIASILLLAIGIALLLASSKAGKKAIGTATKVGAAVATDGLSAAVPAALPKSGNIAAGKAIGEASRKTREAAKKAAAKAAS